MSSGIRPAGPADLDLLFRMHEEFSRETGQAWEPARARAALDGLVRESALGRAFVMDEDGRPQGYLALCFGYSLEFGGRDAFVDEVYVRPASRGRGLARAALRVAEEECLRSGVHALHLEVRSGSGAARLYRAAGFEERGSYLMTRKLR